MRMGRKHQATKGFKPRLEILEDRISPATRVWVANAQGRWLDDTNLVGGNRPTAADTAVLTAGEKRGHSELFRAASMGVTLNVPVCPPRLPRSPVCPVCPPF